MRLAWGVLAAVGALAVMAGGGRSERHGPGHKGPSSPPRGAAHQHRSPAGVHHGAAQEQGVAVARPTSPHHGGFDDDEHKREERRYWKRNYLAAVIGAAATAASFLFAGLAFVGTWRAMLETQREANIAQEALIAADRPWLEAVGLSVNHMEINPIRVSLDLTVRIKNIGRAPAQRAVALTEAIPDLEDGEPERLAVALCRRAAESRAEYSVGGVVFPEALRTARLTRFVLPEDLRSALRLGRVRDRGADGRPLDTSGPPRAAFAIAGCIAYTLPAGGASGETAFVYGLARNCGDAKLVLPCDFDLTERGPYSGDAIVVELTDYAGFAR